MLTPPGPPSPRSGRRCAVLGSPIAHSLSPVLHRAAYDALRLDWTYDAHAVGGPGEPDLAAFLTGLDASWRGLSLTMPLKEPALAAAAVASPHAVLLGAANTLVRREGEADDGWYADSTDATGLRVALTEAGVRPGQVDGPALVLGSGATARSALDALSALGFTEVTFAVRDRARPQTRLVGEALGLHVRERPLTELASYAADHPVVVSTLPTGADLGIDASSGAPAAGAVAMDCGYGGWPTPFARWAGARGATVVSGREMLLHQACAQVELMTGLAAPLAAMRAALDVAG